MIAYKHKHFGSLQLNQFNQTIFIIHAVSMESFFHWHTLGFCGKNCGVFFSLLGFFWLQWYHLWPYIVLLLILCCVPCFLFLIIIVVGCIVPCSVWPWSALECWVLDCVYLLCLPGFLLLLNNTSSTWILNHLLFVITLNISYMHAYL